MTAEPVGNDDDLPETFTDEALKDYFDAELETRRAAVLLDRLKGRTYAEIAAAHGISMSTARKDYRLALAAQAEESPDLGIAKHRAIINELLKANLSAALKGDKDAAVIILRALERDSKLKGYDAPTRVLAAVNTRDFANEAAQLISRIQQLDPDTLKELTRVHRPARPILDQLDARQQPLDAEVVSDPEPPASPAPAPDPGPDLEAEPDRAPGVDPGPAVVVADRRRPAGAPGGKGGDVYSAIGEHWDRFSGSDDARHPDPEGGPDGPAGDDRDRAAADAEGGGSAPGADQGGRGSDDLDGWSNIEDDF